MSKDVAAAGASTSTATQKRLTIRVVREQTLDTGRWVWTGHPQGYPGWAGGRTIPELYEDVEAVKHFMMDEDPSTEIFVDYIYELEGFPGEVLIEYQHGREALRGASENLNAKASATACALRAAGLSLRDGAALMGLSKSRFDQLSAAAKTGPASAEAPAEVCV